MRSTNDIFGIQQKSSQIKESYLDGFNARREEGEIYDLGMKPIFALQSIYRRVDFLTAVVIVFSILVLGALIRLQVVYGSEQLNLAEKNRIRNERIVPSRGLIYDRFGKPLTKNVPSFSLIITPSEFTEDAAHRSAILQTLNSIFPADSEYLQELFVELEKTETQDLYVVKENIGYDSALKIMIEGSEWAGVSVLQSSQRQYLEGYAVAHVLGYTGLMSAEEYQGRKQEYRLNDHIGKTGLERYYEDDLKGIPGVKKVEVEARGRDMKVLNQIDPLQGSDLILTIDTELQKKIIEVFNQYMEKGKIKKAAAVALNPKNGEILALVSLPSYDNNLFVNGVSKEDYQKLIDNPGNPLFNRSTQGEYPPGSTFKLILAAAGLEEGVITGSTTATSVGGITVGQSFFPDWLPGGHGVVTIRQALAHSVNTFFYITGGGYREKQGLGLEKILEYAQKFKLGEPSGIDLPGEAAGFLPSDQWKIDNLGERWYLGDTYHLSIGQGFLLVTPLQIANFTAYFSGNGTVYRPHLLKAKKVYNQKNHEGAVVEIRKEILYENIVSQKNLELVHAGLGDAVTYGSARALARLPVKSGAKTGSAQFSRGKEPHGWFTVFAPYDDPDIVLTALFEESGGAQTVTAPVEDILQWYFETKRE
ncbi:MAG: Peptidoglycan transpeptidase [Parcubacteria group bacterium GW2011_GWA2_44_12]|nr:MAG: Peptidoglycan transpeptidase [Parcubacteria group bacterium GW2011_GWA2_44_12]